MQINHSDPLLQAMQEVSFGLVQGCCTQAVGLDTSLMLDLMSTYVLWSASRGMLEVHAFQSCCYVGLSNSSTQNSLSQTNPFFCLLSAFVSTDLNDIHII